MNSPRRNELGMVILLNIQRYENPIRVCVSRGLQEGMRERKIFVGALVEVDGGVGAKKISERRVSMNLMSSPEKLEFARLDGDVSDVFWGWIKENDIGRRFIKAIYGEDGALNSPSSLSKHSLWLDIIRESGAEEEQLGFLLSRMDGLIFTNILDRWVWSLEAICEFSVKSFRQLIDNLILLKEDVAT
ncbi:hypothetical protein Tco_0854684, partial [Tanacetum coccineum]